MARFKENDLPKAKLNASTLSKATTTNGSSIWD